MRALWRSAGGESALRSLTSSSVVDRYSADSLVAENHLLFISLLELLRSGYFVSLLDLSALSNHFARVILLKAGI